MGVCSYQGDHMRKTLNILFIVSIFNFLGSNYATAESIAILDVRTEAEYRESHVQGALNIDVRENDFKDKLSKLDKSKTYKVYCRSGNRSGQALKIMKTLDFNNIENLGSIEAAAKKLNLTCIGKPC